ncbi:MAG: hypothetical protein GQ525_03810 [Draconibacterium sp.]|nr:hypothetical protein [Draconibacterium sp.]
MKNPFLSKQVLWQEGKICKRLVSWSPFIKLVSWVLIFSMLNLLGGCMNYFRVKNATGSVSDNLVDFYQKNKTFIVHLENKAWILNEPDLQGDKLQGMAYVEYKSTLKNPIKTNGANRYRTNKSYQENYVLQEIHIHVSELSRIADSKISIPLTAIQKIEVYEKDKTTTTVSWVAGILGIAASVWTVLLIIILLTKSSCPFIYVFDGENYQLAGEIYSGSIQSQLERHDFLKLPNYDLNNLQYQIKIANEVKEVQHTNLMELWVFDHDKNVEIQIDKYGKYHSVSALIPPARATNFAGTDVMELVSERDSLYYTSNEINGELPFTDGVVFEFPNPKTSSLAKIVVKAKNSFMLDYMLGQFHDQFGDLYGKWTKKQRKIPAQQLCDWSISQNIPLSLLVERNGEWEPVDCYNVAGPMALKEDVLSFPLNGAESNPLKVKLEFGNYFWEIDYAGIDYSSDQEINYKIIPVKTAINDRGKDVSKKLRDDDRQYYIQPKVGDYAEVNFEFPVLTAESRTIFLHSKGWYQILRNPAGTPDREYLETFREPGRFNLFVNDYIQSFTENQNSE